MVKKVLNAAYIYLLFTIIAITTVAVLSVKTSKETTHAATPVVALKQTKGEFFNGIIDNKAVYEYRLSNSGDGYARNCSAVFCVTSDYYCFYYSVDGGELKPYAGGIRKTPSNGEVVFTADGSVIYEVFCRAYTAEDENTFLEEATAVLKSDLTGPVVPQIAPMDEWKKTGDVYYADINWSDFSDSLSSVYAVSYFYKYRDNTESEMTVVKASGLIGTTALPITESCVLNIICYDNAGNVEQKEFVFDKFDDVPPVAPTYTMTPDYKEGTYSNSYTIEADFHQSTDDIAICGYLLNGVNYVYESPIILNSPMPYEIKLYGVDKAGNVSAYTNIVLPYYAFDVSAPIITSEVYGIDITAGDNICTLSFVGSDAGESGIDKAYLQNSKIEFTKFTHEQYDLFTASFDCYGFLTDKLVVTDKAGNKFEKQIVFDYFSVKQINELVADCAAEFKALKTEEYTDGYYKEIKSAADTLNALLMGKQATEAEIVSKAETLLKMFDTDIKISYSIKSLPKYLSGIITFKVDINDFPSAKKGSVVEVIVNEKKSDGKDYLSLSGFKKGFDVYFGLDFIYNGETIDTPLENGIKVTMNMPLNYYDRDFKIYEIGSGAEIPIETVNNTIIFTAKKSTGYSLIVSGSKTPTGVSAEEKTISVFGNKLKYSTFLWIVCGTAAVAVLLIAGIIVLKKVRG